MATSRSMPTARGRRCSCNRGRSRSGRGGHSARIAIRFVNRFFVISTTLLHSNSRTALAIIAQMTSANFRSKIQRGVRKICRHEVIDVLSSSTARIFERQTWNIRITPNCSECNFSDHIRTKSMVSYFIRFVSCPLLQSAHPDVDKDFRSRYVEDNWQTQLTLTELAHGENKTQK